MNCQESDHLIQQSLDGMLTPNERARLDAHLAHCSHCQAAWEEYRHLTQAASAWLQRSVAADAVSGDAFTAQVMARVAARPALQTRPPIPVWAAWAAVIGLMIGLVFLSPYVRFSQFSLPALRLPAVSALPFTLWTTFRALPSDAMQLVSTFSAGMTLPHWTLAALAGGVFVNAALYRHVTRRHLA